MRIDDTVGPNVDPERKGLVVVFNASDEATTQPVAGTGAAGYPLHPVQATGSDPIVRTASYDGSSRTVHRAGPDGRGLPALGPARTTARRDWA